MRAMRSHMQTGCHLASICFTVPVIWFIFSSKREMVSFFCLELASELCRGNIIISIQNISEWEISSNMFCLNEQLFFWESYLTAPWHCPDVALSLPHIRSTLSSRTIQNPDLVSKIRVIETCWGILCGLWKGWSKHHAFSICLLVL